MAPKTTKRGPGGNRGTRFDVLDEDAPRDPHATLSDGESRATESEDSADAGAHSIRVDPSLTEPTATKFGTEKKLY